MTSNIPQLESENNDTTARLPPSSPPIKKVGFRVWLNSYRKLIVDWTQVLANVTIAAGLIIAIGTYVNETRKTNRETAEQRVALFHAGGVLEARNRLVRLWAGQNLSSLKEGLPRKSINVLVDKTIVSRGGAPGQIDEAILVIADYLDGLGNCRVSDRCNSDVIDNRLGPFAQNFFCIYRGRFKKLRRTRLLPLLGRDLESWVIQLGGCAVSQFNGRSNG